MRVVRTGVVLTAVAAALIGTAGAASATPANAPTSTSTVTFACSNGVVYTGFANSGASGVLTWNPDFLTAPDGSTAVLVPTANDLVVTVAGQTVFAPNASKGDTTGPVTCLVSGGGGDVVVSGSVTGALVAA